MDRQPSNNIFSSTVLFIDNWILSRGNAYTNYSSLFYNMSDPALSNYTVYASPFKQFVSDYSITGANIPSGVYVNGNFVARGTSGLKIDYQNGRVIFNSGVSKNLTVSGNYAIKDFNLYANLDPDESLIYETKFVIKSSITQSFTGLNADSVVAPCVFLVNKNIGNELFAFGGLSTTKINLQCIMLSDSRSYLDSLGNIMVDAKYKEFPVTSNTPYNYFGDFKSGNYNYLNYVNYNNPDYSQLAYISDVVFYKLNNKDLNAKYPDLRFGFADLDIEVVRFPH